MKVQETRDQLAIRYCKPDFWAYFQFLKETVAPL
jgi:hypothetical protein